MPTLARFAERPPAPAAAPGLRTAAAGAPTRAPDTGPGTWTIGALPTDGSRKEPRIAPVETQSVPLAVSAAPRAGAGSPWREPPPRRRAPLILAVLALAIFAAAFAVQRYGLPALQWRDVLQSIAPATVQEPVAAPASAPPPGTAVGSEATGAAPAAATTTPVDAGAPAPAAPVEPTVTPPGAVREAPDAAAGAPATAPATSETPGAPNPACTPDALARGSCR